MAKSPKESAKLISKLSRDVSISEEGIIKVSDMVTKGLIDETICMKTWKSHALHPKDLSLPTAVDWVFFVDTMNFSFWIDGGKHYTVTYQNQTYTGYWSLCAAVNRAIEEGYDITSPKYYSNVSLDTLKYIFRSADGVEIPLLKERHRILNETGKCLVSNFKGTFITCLSQCQNSVQNLLQIIVNNFPSYKDEAIIDEHKVSFYKRAQILIGDIWCYFEGKGYGAFNDIDSITMFADYRVPQLLVYLGVLCYSNELQKYLEKGELLPNGHRYEVEIRGCSIWAVELICQYIKEKQKQGIIPKNITVNSILIDFFLWDFRREHAEEINHIPFHKTRCIYY